jgi:mRNA interferase MazF
MKVSGAILADQIKSLDWRARKAARLCAVSADIMDQTTARILPLVEGV